MGDPGRVAGLDRDLVRQGVSRIRDLVSELVDRVKTSPDPLPVVVVGGGSVLIGDHIDGASEILRPEHFAVANAIGAAIAQVGAEVDKVFSLSAQSRESALDAARTEAIAKAEAAGAVRSTVEIVDIEEVPLAYLPSNAVRIRVKAVGDLPVGD